MWRKQSVCVRCGTFKRRPAQRCKRCGYEPGSDYEMARAVILSRQTQYAGAVIGRTTTELGRIAAAIRGGRPYLFDPNEEQTALYAYRHQLEAAAKSRKLKTTGAFVVVALILLGAYLLLTA